jgi:hypothetical protein
MGCKMALYGPNNRVHKLSKIYGNEDGKHIAKNRVLMIVTNTQGSRWKFYGLC